MREDRAAYDPIATLAAKGITIWWSDLYPDPVTIFYEDRVAFAHTTLGTAGLRAGIAQALSRSDTTNTQAALEFAAHLLINGADLAHVCTHFSDPLSAARALGVTLAMFDQRVTGLNKRARNLIRLAAARDLCPRCRIQQGPLAMEI